MKQYPSIEQKIHFGEPVYVFGKEDGSNMRVEWDRKKGFHKWGRRNGLLDDSNPILKRFPEVFLEKYGTGLDEALRKARFEQVVCFAEFHGPNSFAGTHKEEEQQTATLFDVDVYKKGLMPPKEFLEHFGHLPVQSLLYEGNFTQEIYNQVRAGTLPGMPLEGVVCKGVKDRKSAQPLMFKVKSLAWLQRLREHCNGNETLFNQLA